MKKKYLVIIGIIALFLVVLIVGFALYYKTDLDNRTKASVINNDTPNNEYKTWAMTSSNSSTSAMYTYDTTALTIDSTGAYPQALVNKANTDWSAVPITPSGYILAGTQATYSATDFLVMKYEAKCANTATPTVGLTSPADTSYETYSDYKAADTSNQCTTANGRSVVSLPGGYPIAHISQTEAKLRCSSVSINGKPLHLITNDEWMTIARNVEKVQANWSSGTVGTGSMFSGHNDDTPSKVLVASPDDLQSKINTGPNEQVRTLALANGQPIWDFAGNLWEWTDNTITGINQPVGTGTDTGFKSREFTALTTYGTGLTADQIKPSVATYNSTKGVGQIYSGKISSTDSTNYGYLRGGSFRDNSISGAFAMNLNYLPSDQKEFIGFRCASEPFTITKPATYSATADNEVAAPPLLDVKFINKLDLADTSMYEMNLDVYNPGPESDVKLFYFGQTIPTKYTDISATKAAGWKRLSASIKGGVGVRGFGFVLKAGKTIKFAKFSIIKEPTIFLAGSYSFTNLNKWNSFCEGTLGVSTSGSSACTTNPGFDTRDSTKGKITYQLCDNDGSVCETGSTWKYWNGSAWVNATSNMNSNTSAELSNQTFMQAFPTASKKISFKAIFSISATATAANYPKLPHLSIGLTTGAPGLPTANCPTAILRVQPNSTTPLSQTLTVNPAQSFKVVAVSGGNTDTTVAIQVQKPDGSLESVGSAGAFENASYTIPGAYVFTGVIGTTCKTNTATVTVTATGGGSTASSTASTSSSASTNSSNNTSNDVVTTSSSGSTTSSNIHASCVAYDFNNDGRIDIMDFAKWRACYQKKDAQIASSNCGFADIIKNNVVDIMDFASFVVALTNYRTTTNKACVR
ncbi:MAG: SUMF1/EgtB/PvdO family nonheme iron enzyme [bacterium]